MKYRNNFHIQDHEVGGSSPPLATIFYHPPKPRAITPISFTVNRPTGTTLEAVPMLVNA